MMRAAQMYGPDDVRITTVPIPEINENELLVKVMSAGICGTDLRIIKNGYPGITSDSPRILGHEISGLIVDKGNNVSGYTIGSRVAIAPNTGCGTCDNCIKGDYHLCHSYKALGVQMDGGFAEYVRVPEAAVRLGNIALLPDHVTYDEAAIIEPLSCVYNGLLQCPVQLGDDVLIIGAGPIGIMYAYLAELSGAARVFITNRSKERLEICKQLNPSFVTLQSEGLKDNVLSLTDGKGVNMCVTANSSPEAQQMAIELTAMHGRINFFGGLPKQIDHVGLNTNMIHYKQLQVTGSTKANNHHFRKMLQFIASGLLDVQPLISARYSIQEFDQALQFTMNSRGIKTIINFDE